MLALRRAGQTERLKWSRPMKMSQKQSISTRGTFDANERLHWYIQSKMGEEVSAVIIKQEVMFEGDKLHVRSSWAGTEILV